VVDLLVWAGQLDADRRYRTWLEDGRPELREDALRWLGGRWGAASTGILNALRGGRPPSDLLPLGLLADIVTAQGRPVGNTDDNDRRALDEADRESLILRTRLESTAGTPLSPTALDGWAKSAVLAADRISAEPTLAVVQRRADALARELAAGSLVERSDYLPAALDARLNRLADAVAAVVVSWGQGERPDAAGMDRLESACNRVAEHVIVGATPEQSWPRDVSLAMAVLRLLRYACLDAPDLRTLAGAVAWYRSTGSWVDAAVNDAFVGSDRPRLAEVAHQVVQRTREHRAGVDRSAADLLAVGGAYRPAPASDAPMMIEDVLDRVVLPLTTPAPPEPGRATPGRAMPGCGCGLRPAGGAARGRRRNGLRRRQRHRDRPCPPAFGHLATGRPGRPRRTAHRGGGDAADGDRTIPVQPAVRPPRPRHPDRRGHRVQYLVVRAFSRIEVPHAVPQGRHRSGVRRSRATAEVRQAIDDIARRPVVACVLNAIDDALDRSDPIGTRWTTSTLHPLDALLHAATRVGRIVVLVSDHGHVVERRERDLQRGDTLPARWRRAPAGVEVSGDEVSGEEVLVQGDRVLTENGRAVLAVDEQLRYTRRKAGYHGGAALAEFVVPIVVLVPGEIPRHLPLVAAGSVPTWWVGAESLTRAVATPPTTSARPPLPTRPSGRARDETPALFDEPGPRPPIQTAASMDRIGRLLGSRQFTANRERFAPQVGVDQIGRLLRALVAAGGSLGRPQAGAALGVAERRLAGNLAVIGQILNIDGIVVLGQSTTEVTLHEGLLFEQFGIAP
ncbi:MAG TPA: BREX-2 system phosphatase PglZ, partial [Nakamurella sp.]